MTKRQKSWRQRLQTHPFFIRLFSWEYWPIYIVNIPVVLFWLLHAMRARSLFFFSTVNPAIETGGVMGESKINILNRIPKERIPKTIFIARDCSLKEVIRLLKLHELEYPLIAKPNVGERGLLVQKLSSDAGLQAYLEKNKVDFIIQSFVDLPIELSIMYHRFPGSKKGKVTSICVKEYLKVTGNGSSTVLELMENYPRAVLQLDRMKVLHRNILHHIPAAGETIQLEPIGNHCRGTMFLNGNHLIDEALTAAINEVGQQMEDIFFGRFDMKCQSIEELRAGNGFKIMEFNGVASEPAHIYDPSYSVFKAYRDIFHHWQIIYQISKIQRQKGYTGMSLREAYESLHDYFDYLRLLKT